MGTMVTVVQDRIIWLVQQMTSFSGFFYVYMWTKVLLITPTRHICNNVNTTTSAFSYNANQLY